MADLSITAGSVIASAQATIDRRYSYGATVTQGQPVYLDTGNLWQLADANASATTAAVRGIVLVGGAINQPGIVVTTDPNFTPGATLAVGTMYVLSANAGKICPVADSVTGVYNSLLFIANTSTTAVMTVVNGPAPIP